MPKPKPDDRSDNVDKLQDQVVNTIENLEAAHETLRNEDLPEEQRQAILAKTAVEKKRLQASVRKSKTNTDSNSSRTMKNKGLW